MKSSVSEAGRYRHVPGGLDHAVKQAEQRGLHDWFIVDADCHQAEPLTLFGKYLPEKWRREYGDKDLMELTKTNREYYERFAATPEDPMDPNKAWLAMLYEEFKDNAPFDREMHGRVLRPEAAYTSEAYHEQREEEVVD